MAFLGRQQKDEDDDLGGDRVSLDLDDLVCPTCGRDLPPWVDTCPDDGTAAVPRSSTTDRTPEIPAHLLEGLDDLPVPSSDDQPDGGGGDRPDVVDSDMTDPSPSDQEGDAPV